MSYEDKEMERFIDALLVALFIYELTRPRKGFVEWLLNRVSRLPREPVLGMAPNAPTDSDAPATDAGQHVVSDANDPPVSPGNDNGPRCSHS